MRAVVQNRLLRRLLDPVIGPPPCAICGHGHAQTGWVVDPFGGTHGRCPHCIDSVAVGALAPATPKPQVRRTP
ncbi:MAG TPA: hypothetical protein VGA41_07990 [Candidatus Dormibacteraeota bacterium]